MPEVSFLLAHVLAVIVLFGQRDGFDRGQLALGLSVLVPPLLSKAALLLPRLAHTQRVYKVGRAQTAIAWIGAGLFLGAAALVVDQFARKDLLREAWQLVLSLAALEAIYGVYAAWFVQSRVIFNERQARALREQLTQQEFDVFLCHNSRDKPAVKALAVRLMQRGLKPWLDEWELRPGLRWLPPLEEQIRAVKSAAVFIGADGIGPWQSEEIGSFLTACVQRGIPVIPVLLDNTPDEPQLPPFLDGRTRVDFRQNEPDPLEQLIFGISGQRGAVR